MCGIYEFNTLQFDETVLPWALLEFGQFLSSYNVIFVEFGYFRFFNFQNSFVLFVPYDKLNSCEFTIQNKYDTKDNTTVDLSYFSNYNEPLS
mgnify:CR=1 FL=1